MHACMRACLLACLLADMYILYACMHACLHVHHVCMHACSDYLSGTRGLWGESGDVGLNAVCVYRASSSVSLTVVS